MAGFAGALAGLGGEGEALERARQQRIVETLAQAQERRAQAQETRAERESRDREALGRAPQPIGNPFRGADGKVYRRYADPLTGAITTRTSPEPEAESKVGDVIRQIREAKAKGIDIPVEEQQRLIEAALGGRAMLTQPRANKFGSFVADPSSPTGYSREILDGTTLAPTGQRDDGVPPGYLPKEHTGWRVMTDIDGEQYLVPAPTETRGSVLKPSGAPASGGRGGKPTRSSATPPRPPSAPATGNLDASGKPLPPGARHFGHKALDAMSRRSLVAAEQSRSGLARIDRLFTNRPELQSDNNPITSAISWLEYSRGHFEPSDPVRSTLIKEAALVGITAAGLYSQGRMSKYLFEKAQQHLPQPNDSPKLLYSKMAWLRDNHIIEDMIADIKDPFRPHEGEGGPSVTPSTTPATPSSSNPLGLDLPGGKH